MTTTSIWLDRNHATAALVPGWTDILIDLREDPFRGEPPVSWESAADPTLTSAAEGWQADLMVVRHLGENRTRGGDTYLRFTTPDNSRFTVAVSRPTGEGAALRWLEDLFPTMREVLLITNGRRQPLQLSGFGKKRERIYSLPALRAAVLDPDGWFGRPGNGRDSLTTTDVRILLSWASAGETAWEDVRRFVEVGFTPVEQRRWSWEWTDDEMVEWCRVVAPTDRQWARRWRAAGWEPQEAGEWMRAAREHLRDAFVRDAEVMLLWDQFTAYRRAGLTPTQMCEHARHFEDLYYERWGCDFGGLAVHQTLSEAAPWARIGNQERWTAYYRAGFDPEEAVALEGDASPPSLDQILLIAALSGWSG